MAIPCTKCSTGSASVRETRGTRRTRTCRECGAVFYTQEVSEEELAVLKQWREEYRQVVTAVAVLMTAPLPGEDPN